MNLNDIPVRIEGFITREIGDETILISGDGKKMHTFDAVGSSIWKNIDGKNSIERLIDNICDEYDVERSVAEKDLQSFINDVTDKKIILIRK